MPINDQPNPFQTPNSGGNALGSDPSSSNAPLAGRGTRLASAFLDGLVIIIPVMVIAFLVGAFDLSGKKSAQDPIQSLLIGGGAILFYLILNGWLLHTRGQTLGKMIMKIRIVRVDRQPTSGMDTIVKRIIPVQVIGMIPILGGIFSLIDMLFIFREDRRCIHDLIAGTEVITLS